MSSQSRRGNAPWDRNQPEICERDLLAAVKGVIERWGRKMVDIGLTVWPGWRLRLRSVRETVSIDARRENSASVSSSAQSRDGVEGLEQDFGYTYNINASIPGDGDDRVQGTEINA